MESIQGGSTHDWALDFEPLALPPDLPPVILVDLVETVKLERWKGWVEMEMELRWWWAWSVETMDCLLLSGGGAVL